MHIIKLGKKLQLKTSEEKGPKAIAIRKHFEARELYDSVSNTF